MDWVRFVILVHMHHTEIWIWILKRAIVMHNCIGIRVHEITLGHIWIYGSRVVFHILQLHNVQWPFGIKSVHPFIGLHFFIAQLYLASGRIPLNFFAPKICHTCGFNLDFFVLQQSHHWLQANWKWSCKFLLNSWIARQSSYLSQPI